MRHVAAFRRYQTPACALTVRPICAGKDELLTFEELKEGLAPVLHGDKTHRSAFMFVLYDKDESNQVSLRELGELHGSVPAGCIIERDLARV